MKNKFSIFMACLAMAISIPTSMQAVEKEDKEGKEYAAQKAQEPIVSKTTYSIVDSVLELESRPPYHARYIKQEAQEPIVSKIECSVVEPELPCSTHYKGPHEGAIAIERELRSQAHPFNISLCSTLSDQRILLYSIHDRIGMDNFIKVALAGRITRIKCNDVRIGAEEAMQIGRRLPELRYLSVHNTKLGTAGARGIADGRNLSHLTRLEISNNEIRCLGARAIALGLPQLEYLNARNNKIGFIGAKAIADNLKQLEYLDIAKNEIEPKGAIEIGRGLTKLQYLDVSYNGLTPEAREEIMPMLRKRIATVEIDYPQCSQQ